MSNDKFGWDDVLNSQQGIFGNDAPTINGGSAMTEFATARTTPTEQGLVVEMMCESDGRMRSMTIEYPELVAIKYGIQPQAAYGHIVAQGKSVPFLTGQLTALGYDQKAKRWFPDGRCSCGAPLRPLISVAEAEGALRAAQAAPWIPVQTVNELSNHCARMAQRG